MNNNNKNFNVENDTILDSLCDVVRTSEKYPKLLNAKRYFEMLVAKDAIDDILEQNDSGKSEISLKPLFCMGSVTAEVDDFEVHDLTAMQIAISLADNIDFYPLSNGKIRIAFTFNNMMTTLR